MCTAPALCSAVVFVEDIREVRAGQCTPTFRAHPLTQYFMQQASASGAPAAIRAPPAGGAAVAKFNLPYGEDCSLSIIYTVSAARDRRVAQLSKSLSPSPMASPDVARLRHAHLQGSISNLAAPASPTSPGSSPLQLERPFAVKSRARQQLSAEVHLSTLDLVALSPEDAQIWIAGLNFLLAKRRNTRLGAQRLRMCSIRLISLVEGLASPPAALHSGRLNLN